MKHQDSPNRLTDQMVFIALGLAFVYWAIDSILNLFTSHKSGFYELVFGGQIDEIWPRIIVLCLFFIFGSHAQYTMDNRKKAEKALRESEARYRTLVENIPIGICRNTPGPQGKFLMANPSFLKMFGFGSPDELERIAFQDLFYHDRDCRMFSESLIQNGSIAWSEVVLKKSTGLQVWGSVTARVIRDGKNRDGEYFDCTFEDIDERKKSAIKAQEEAETRRRFQKLLSPALAEMVVSGKLKVEKGGESRKATVLFADIRGFTAISENSEPSEVLQMLNEYFESVVEIVFQYEGTVDKFIGDAVMVLWGAPISQEDGPLRAVKAALEMRTMLSEFNERRRSEGKREIQVGIGLNSGRLVAGYIGSSQTMSYSVIGDTVNTASRLCSVAKSGQILITESTHQLVGKHFRLAELDPIVPKGMRNPIPIYNVEGLKDDEKG